MRRIFHTFAFQVEAVLKATDDLAHLADLNLAASEEAKLAKQKKIIRSNVTHTGSIDNTVDMKFNFYFKFFFGDFLLQVERC